MKYLRTVTDNQIIEERSKATCISLFTGCGGFDVGMSQAGIESRVMVEFSEQCCQTLRANFHWEELKKRTDEKGKPDWKTKEEMKKDIDWYHDREPVILQEDITKLSTETILEAAGLNIGEATVVIGGPPCQGFSTAGRRILEDPRNKLFKEFVRVVKETLPRMFIFENVPGLTSMAKGEVIKQICKEFASAGYDIQWDILNAADYGVPQHRKRVFIIGKRIDLMRITEEGRIQLHIGATPGRIKHPEKFRKKHKLPLEEYDNKKQIKKLLKTLGLKPTTGERQWIKIQ